MSIFSKLKNAKRAANDHKQAIATSQKQASTTQSNTYTHIPKHAAQDHLSSVPTSWSVEESRAKIAAYHERKTAVLLARRQRRCTGEHDFDFSSSSSGTPGVDGSQVSLSSSMGISSVEEDDKQKEKRGTGTRSPYSYAGAVPLVPVLPRAWSTGNMGEAYRGAGRESVSSGRRRESPLSSVSLASDGGVW